MNKLNSKLFYAFAAIVLAFLVLGTFYTLYHLFTFNVYDVAFFDPFKVQTESFQNMYFTFSQVLPELWAFLQTSNSFYVNLLADYVGDAIATLIFFAIGVALVIMGLFSKPSGNCKGPESDPREYIFTHRRLPPLKILAMPWNAITACLNFKKVPVIIPIIFLPLMAPFALYADVLLIVLTQALLDVGESGADAVLVPLECWQVDGVGEVRGQ